MTFYAWVKENRVELNEDYSRADMEWFAELAWDAAIQEGYNKRVNEEIQRRINHGTD